MEAGSVFVKIGADMSGFNRSMSKMKDSLGKAQKGFKDLGTAMTTRVTAPILGVGAAMLKSAADLEATGAKYETVFKGMTTQADSFIEEFQKLTPATKAEARSMASGMQDLLVPMGFARDEAADMTGEFLHVAGALTNFNSATHSAQDVTAALQSAMTGQYDSLKSLGIQLDATTVKEKAVEMGLADSTKEVTKQQQAQVLLAEVYNQSGDALDAYTAENLDTTTKMQLMKAEVTDLAATFGEIMLPALTSLVDKVRGVVEWLGQLSEGQREMILRVGAAAAAIGPLSLALSGVISVVLKVMNGVKLLKTALLALSGPVGLTVVAIGALIAVGVHFYKNSEEVRDRVNAAFDSMRKFVERILSQVTVFFEREMKKILAFWNLHGEQIMRAVQNVFEFILSIIEVVMPKVQQLIAWTWNNIADIIEGVVGIIKGIILAFTAVLTGDFELLKTALLGIWDSLWTMVEEVVLNVIALAEDWGGKLIKMFVRGIEAGISLVKDAVSKVAGAISDFLGFSSPTEKGPASDSDKWAPNFMEMFAKGIESKKERVKGAVEDVAGVIRDTLDTINRSIDNSINNINLRYELWAAKNREAEDSVLALQAKLHTYSLELGLTDKKVAETKAAIEQATKEFGANSDEVLELTNKLLRLQIEQANLKNNIDDTTKAIREQKEAMEEAADVSKMDAPKVDLTKANIEAGAFKNIRSLLTLQNLDADIRDEITLRKKGTGEITGISISGNTFEIREEADIRKVARELYNMQVSASRGVGV